VAEERLLFDPLSLWVVRKPLGVAQKSLWVVRKPLSVEQKPLWMVHEPLGVEQQPLSIVCKPLWVEQKPLSIGREPLRVDPMRNSLRSKRLPPVRGALTLTVARCAAHPAHAAHDRWVAARRIGTSASSQAHGATLSQGHGARGTG
jgi:hypothetical protein